MIEINRPGKSDDIVRKRVISLRDFEIYDESSRSSLADVKFRNVI